MIPQEKQYFCFLWSFCPSLINNVREVFNDLKIYLKNQFSNPKEIGDMEHGLYCVLDPGLVHHVDRLHLIAQVGNNKNWMLI